MTQKKGKKAKLAADLGALPLQALASDEPLEARANRLRTEMENAQEQKPRLALEYALITALSGDALETEFALRFAREWGEDSLASWVDFYTAFVGLRLGDFSRALAALRRVDHLEPGSELHVLSQLLYAQALLREDGADAAFIMVEQAAPGLVEGSNVLRAFGAVIRAEVALAEENFDEALDALADLKTSGILGALAEFLKARAVSESTSPDFVRAREYLSRAAWKLTDIGARRELGLVYIGMSRVEAGGRVEPGSEPVQWLARAHTLLSKAGTPQDMEALQRAFRLYGRRALDRLVDGALAARIDKLRASRSRLRDVVAAQRDNRAAAQLQANDGALLAELSVDDHELDEVMLELRDSSEEVVSSLEDLLVDRERTEQLAGACAALAEVSDVPALYHELARVALRVCPGNVANIVIRESDRLRDLASVGLAIPLDGQNAMRIGRAIERSYERGAAQFIDEPLVRPSSNAGKVAQLGAESRGRACVVPFGTGGPASALFVAKTQGGGRISERDLDRLVALTKVATRIHGLLIRPISA